MPAMKIILALTLLLVLSLTSLPAMPKNSNPQPGPFLSPSPPQSSEVGAALRWLSAHEYANGSYGQYLEGQAAAAAYALSLNDSESRYSASSYSYLAGQLEDPTNFLWFESDVPGEVLFSLTMTGHLGLLHDVSGVSSRLLQLQESTGGFEGYYNTTTMQTVTSSVDTAMALWGLSNAQAMPADSRTAAVKYLLTLQNPDGSFNLAHNGVADPVYSLGPDRTSITALVALSLRDNGFNSRDSSILKALDFLAEATSLGFNGQGHVYDAALSTLAFLQYYHPREAANALEYLIQQQNSDGGFGDVSRYTLGSNALDTGWASVALQFGISQSVIARGAVNRPPTAKFSFNPEEPKNGTVVSFDATHSSDLDNDSLSYAWTFGDGGSASGLRVAHVYSRSGVYTVTLTVTDSGVNPDSLLNTAWLKITVQQSSAPAKAASSPPPLPANAWLALAGLPAMIVAGYLIVRTNRRRRLRK